MSRHKLVKALDLDEELYDFDGLHDDENDGQDDISAEDKEQLRTGTARVRNVLGPDIQVTDREIEESLWHYYYDAEKTVNYLLGQKTKAAPKKKVEKPAATRNDIADVTAVLAQSYIDVTQDFTKPSTADFFSDCPWLDIPKARLGEILLEPSYPRGGLLGGSASQGSGKPSKLAALAAARRQKESGKKASDSSSSSVAILDKLYRKDSPTMADPSLRKPEVNISETTSPQPSVSRPSAPKHSTRRPESADQSGLKESKSNPETRKPIGTEAEKKSEPLVAPVATPSAFAQTIFGSPSDRSPSEIPFPTIGGPLDAMNKLQYALSNTSRNDSDSNAFAGPSPDDIVLKARSSKGPKGAKAASAKNVNSMPKAVENVAVTETPKVKSKNLNVLAEFEKTKQKPAANFVVIGHVDAGKSTLMGRLLYDLKVVDQRTLEKYRKEAESIGKSSFALAWVLDQGTDERSQGVTIDIGMNKFETDKTAFTILDAPGHRDFIPNMIAGASQADFAVLVIDASTGSFESGLKGQTREHALLVRSMGVQRIIVAINKLDTLSWSQDRFDEIQQQVSAFLTAAGFQAKNLAFLPCSGLTGDNIVRKATEPNASWYTGPPLITLLESSEPFARALEKPLRLTIDDIFRGGIQNPLSISGRIDSGSIQVGDVVLVIPAAESASIKGIEVDAEPRDWAVAGQNAILHLADIDQKYLKTGDVICPPSAPVKPLKIFTMKVLAFEHLLPMAVEVLRGRLHAPGKISKLVAVLDKSTGQPVEGTKKKVKIVKPGSVARVVVEVEEAVPLEVGGRVVLRAGGETVGAGLLE